MIALPCDLCDFLMKTFPVKNILLFDYCQTWSLSFYFSWVSGFYRQNGLGLETSEICYKMINLSRIPSCLRNGEICSHKTLPPLSIIQLWYVIIDIDKQTPTRAALVDTLQQHEISPMSQLPRIKKFPKI